MFSDGQVSNILKHLFPVPKDDSKRVLTFANMSDYISFRHHTYEQPTGVKSIELKVQRLLVNLVMLVMMAQRRCSGPPHAITAAHLAGAVHACLAVTLTRTLSIAGARPALRVQAVPDQAGDHGPAARGQRVRAARLHPQRQEGPAGGGGGGGPAVTNQCGRYMMGCWQPFDASRRTVLPDALGLHFGGDSAFAENELRVRSDGPPVVVLRSPRQYRDAQRSVLLILMVYRSLSMGAPITGALFSCPFPVQNAGFYRTNCSLQPARCGHLQMFKGFPSRGFLALQHRTGTIPLTRCVSSLPTWAVRFEFAS